MTFEKGVKVRVIDHPDKELTGIVGHVVGKEYDFYQVMSEEPLPIDFWDFETHNEDEEKAMHLMLPFPEEMEVVE